jgi:hypothetical protein
MYIEMPYRRYKKKRFSRRRKSGYTTGGSIKYLARKAYKGVKFLRGLVNVENKKFDVAAVGQAVDWAGTQLARLSTVQGGDDVNNRNGNSILAKKLLFRFTARNNTTADSTMMRCIIFYDTQNNGTDPTASLVLESGQLSTVNSVNAPLNVDSAGRFTVLRDKVFSMNSQLDGAALTKHFEYWIPLNFHIKFTNVTTGGWTNQLYVLFLSDQQTNTPAVDYSSRLMFYDN